MWYAENHLRNQHLYNWIRTLLKRGFKPEFEVIEENRTEEENSEREKYWIAYYRKITDLVNMDEGGKGWGIGNKIWSGRKHTEEYKLLMEKKLMGHDVSLESRLKMSTAKKRNFNKIEYKSKLNRGAKAKEVIVRDVKTKKILYKFSSLLEASKILKVGRSYLKNRSEKKLPYLNYLIEINERTERFDTK